MTSSSLLILKACAVAFFGAFISSGLSLIVLRGINKENALSASGGLPMILSFGSLVALCISFSMLGSIQFEGVSFLLVSYVAAIATVFFLGKRFPKKN